MNSFGGMVHRFGSSSRQQRIVFLPVTDGEEQRERR